MKSTTWTLATLTVVTLFAGCSGGTSVDSATPKAEPVSLTRVEKPTPPPVEVPALPEPEPVVDPATAWKEGARLYDARAYGEAAESLRIAAEGRPGDAYTHYLFGLSLWKSGEREAAEEALLHAASLNPDSVKTWINLARVRMDRDDHQGALEAADAALEKDEASADALHQKGRALAALGRGEEAVEILRRAHEAAPGNGYIANTLGYVLIRSGDPVEAVPFLEAAKEKLPRVAYVRNNLGVALERTGEVDRAVEEFRAAVEAGDPGGRAAASLARLAPPVETDESEDVAVAQAQ